MDVYNTNDCSGDFRSVNVWDNSCASWMGGFRSYKFWVYGGSHQSSHFFPNGNCGNLFDDFGGGWVDSGGNIKIGQCYTFGDRVANAASSWNG
jgi:hypothetical protein